MLTSARLPASECRAVPPPPCSQKESGNIGVVSRPTGTEIKNRLAQNGEQAIALKIFGDPTLVVNNQLFWGNDATEMAMQYIANPSMIDDDREMQHINDLPEAIQRVTNKS